MQLFSAYYQNLRKAEKEDRRRKTEGAKLGFTSTVHTNNFTHY